MNANKNTECRGKTIDGVKDNKIYIDNIYYENEGGTPLKLMSLLHIQ